MARTLRLLCNISCHFKGTGKESHSMAEEVVNYCQVFSLRCEQSRVNPSFFPLPYSIVIIGTVSDHFPFY